MKIIRKARILFLFTISNNTLDSHTAALATIPLSIVTTWYKSKEQQKAREFKLALETQSQAGDVVSERKLKEFNKHYTLSTSLDAPIILSATSVTALFAEKLSMSTGHIGSAMHHTAQATILPYIAIGLACTSIITTSYECHNIKKAIKSAQAITRDTLRNEAQDAQNLLKKLE